MRSLRRVLLEDFGFQSLKISKELLESLFAELRSQIELQALFQAGMRRVNFLSG